MRVRSVAAAALIAIVVALSAGPATAHSGQGLLELEARAGATPLSVKFTASLVFANDLEPVSTASVVVRAFGPAGETVGPIEMASTGEGKYTTDITLPSGGPWKLQATATDPDALSEIAYNTVDPAPTTTQPATSNPSPGTPTATGAAGSPSSTDGSGPNWLFAILIALVLVLIGVVGVAVLRTRERPGSDQP